MVAKPGRVNFLIFVVCIIFLSAWAFYGPEVHADELTPVPGDFAFLFGAILSVLPAWVPDVILAIPYVVTAAAALAAFTPTPKDDSFWAKVRPIVDWLALNVRSAKNAASVKDPNRLN